MAELTGILCHNRPVTILECLRKDFSDVAALFFDDDNSSVMVCCNLGLLVSCSDDELLLKLPQNPPGLIPLTRAPPAGDSMLHHTVEKANVEKTTPVNKSTLHHPYFYTSTIFP